MKVKKIKMGNFLLFRGDIYYPSGGAEDLQGFYETLDEAKAANYALILEDEIYSENVKNQPIEKTYYENYKSCKWSHIYGLDSKTIVWSQFSQACIYVESKVKQFIGKTVYYKNTLYKVEYASVLKSDVNPKIKINYFDDFGQMQTIQCYFDFLYELKEEEF